MNNTVRLLMLYVQKVIADGLEPDQNGTYSITRKEFVSRLELSSSTFDKNRDDFLKALSKGWDLEIMFDLKGLPKENLYTDVRYEKGVLYFKRNPITFRPELSYVWGVEPPYWNQKIFVWPYIPVPDNVNLPISK